MRHERAHPEHAALDFFFGPPGVGVHGERVLQLLFRAVGDRGIDLELVGVLGRANGPLDLDLGVAVHELAALPVSLDQVVVDGVEVDLPVVRGVEAFVAEVEAQLSAQLDVRGRREVDGHALLRVLGGAQVEVFERSAFGAQLRMEARCPDVTELLRLADRRDRRALVLERLLFGRFLAEQLRQEQDPQEHGEADEEPPRDTASFHVVLEGRGSAWKTQAESAA